MIDSNTVRFGEDGLIPAIVQHVGTGQVLMLAYMNKESLEVSVAEGTTCFYSRSRKALWRKGETSGNTQEICSIMLDCDSDSLLVKVLPAGPACHTNEPTCFHIPFFGTDTTFTPETLYQLITQRQTTPEEGSYTSYLFQEGVDKILKKVGEEATEVVIAAKNRDSNELIYEVSDLVYHVLVLLVEQGVSVEEIRKELAKRHNPADK